MVDEEGEGRDRWELSERFKRISSCAGSVGFVQLHLLVVSSAFCFLSLEFWKETDDVSENKVNGGCHWKKQKTLKINFQFFSSLSPAGLQLSPVLEKGNFPIMGKFFTFPC
jgi:hypothetical protein